MFMEKLKKVFNLDNIFIFCLYLVSFWIPLDKRVFPIIIVIFLTFSLFRNDFWKGLRKSFKIFSFILIIGFYFFHVLSLLYSSDLNRAFFDLEVKLSLLIFPIIIFNSGNIVLINKKKILLSFIIGNFVASIVCLGSATYFSILNGGNDFFNSSLWSQTRDWTFLKLIIKGYSYYNYSSLSVFHHPSYFTLYLSFAIYIVYFYLLIEWKTMTKGIKTLSVGIIGFYLIMIFLLQSRAGQLAISFIIIVEIIRYFVYGKNLFYKLALSSISVLMIFSTIYYSGRFENFYRLIAENEINETNTRIMIWENSIQIIKENPLLGVGTGDIIPELHKKYTKSNMIEAKEKNYNSHNQFLESFMGLGIIGGGILLILVFGPLISVKRNNKLIIAFGILIAIHFLFESMLNTIAGVTFFGFFYSLLHLHKINN